LKLVIKEVSSRKELKAFIHLPDKIHRNHDNWLPPIYADEKRFFDSMKNRAFRHCDTCLLLAVQNGKAVGRIMGIIHHRSNEIHDERNARFGFMECFDDQRAAHSLLQSIENWARESGMVKVVGPMGFTDQDPEGFLIEGFDETPTIACTYNLDYMNRLVINEGYQKEIDYVVYKVPVPATIPEKQLRIYQWLLKRGNFRIIEFSRRRELKPLILPVFELMNECFKDIYGYVPLDEMEMQDLTKRYLPVVDPRFIKIVLDKVDSLSGFIVGLPNFSEGIRRSRGRLFPLGLFHILRASKRTKQLDLLIGGIKAKYRGLGLDTMLALKMIESAQKAGFKYMDSHRELETNLKIRAEMEHWGGHVYKRFRIYQKNLR